MGSHSDVVSTLIERVVDDLASEQDNNIRLYEVDGRKVFELRSPTGGVENLSVAYLTCWISVKHSIELPILTNLDDQVTRMRIIEKVKSGFYKFQHLLGRLKEAKFWLNLDGGELGRENKGCPYCGHKEEKGSPEAPPASH